MNRLEECIKILGWQGGTIHQINEIASLDGCCGERVNILLIPDEDWSDFINQFRLFVKKQNQAPRIYLESKGW